MSKVPEFDFVQPKERKPRLPLVLLVSRAVTLLSLIVSLILLKINKLEKTGYYTYSYHNVSSYKYAFFIMVVGFGYTLMQSPFAIYYFIRRKSLIKNDVSLWIDFYGDKVISLILATGLGAYFGVTVDSKRYTDKDRHDQFTGYFDKFYDIAYVSAGFLLLAFLGSIVSSIISAMALSRKG